MNNDSTRATAAPYPLCQKCGTYHTHVCLGVREAVPVLDSTGRELTRWTFDGGDTATVDKNGQWVMYKDIAAREPAPVASDLPWRCFHCEETFTDREEARLHFGNSERQKPACQFDIAEVRDMEARIAAYSDEDAEIHREMHAQASKHAQALLREEEKGYARGLRDAGVARDLHLFARQGRQLLGWVESPRCSQWR